MFQISMNLTGIVAGLCVLAFPVWILGIPGVENNYAKGWKMGLTGITCYPALWLVNYIAFWIIRRQMNRDNWPQLENVSAWIALGLFMLGFVWLVWSFRIMSKGG